jgi:secreted trypsin-like serine protease
MYFTGSIPSVLFQALKFSNQEMFASNIVIFVFMSLVNANNIVPYLSNGDAAQITEFPFLVSIQQINVHICGGSLLNDRWILSSARCFVMRPINELNIEYGSSEITPGPNGLNKALISRVIVHEDFVQSTLKNDVSLVESATTIVTGFHEPYTKLIIPGGSQFRSGTQSVHAGWGHVQQGVRTTKLQKAKINILSFEECVAAVEETQRPTKYHICAMAESVMCSGDLGIVALCSFSSVSNRFF